MRTRRRRAVMRHGAPGVPESRMVVSNEKKGVVIRRRRPEEAEAPAEVGGADDAAKAAEAVRSDGTVPPHVASSQAPSGGAAPVERVVPRGTRQPLHSRASPHPQEVAGLAPVPDRPRPRVEREKPAVRAPLPTEDDFAAMFEGSEGERAAGPAVQVGEKVSVRVVSVGRDALFVELGGKTEGIVDRREFEDEEGVLTVGVGDEIQVHVLQMGEGTIRLGRSLGRQGQGAAALEDAQAQAVPVEGRVTGTNKGGYEVEVAGVTAFCPHSQIDLEFTADPSEHVGRSYRFLVTRCEEGGRNVVLSRAALLREERDAAAEQLLETLAPEAVVEGTVSRVEPFGAFVDLGGVDGLVHVSELSWARVEHPEELVKVGDRVRVKVLRIEETERGPRIGLSMRALGGDPWDEAFERYQVGDVVSGTVQRLERFGAFVELMPGVDGLVHISELAHGRRINHPKEVIAVGEAISVQVLSMDPRRRQIGLSMKALAEDPWVQVARELQPGTRIQGTVASTREFGIFVEVPGGVTALLPLSELPEEEKASWRRTYAPGNAVEATVLHCDAERRRLTLSRRPDDEGAEQRAFAQWKQSGEAGSEGLGTMADLLRKRGS
ncbi:MAG: S1 RNA-binding domain-containing protein [Deltaproteobacteria bacterium]|nr:MAG: S1 RNA-binding domain-containing protein [Deltaproteobacteria bacterium]